MYVVVDSVNWYISSSGVGFKQNWIVCSSSAPFQCLFSLLPQNVEKVAANIFFGRSVSLLMTNGRTKMKNRTGETHGVWTSFPYRVIALYKEKKTTAAAATTTSKAFSILPSTEKNAISFLFAVFSCLSSAVPCQNDRKKKDQTPAGRRTSPGPVRDDVQWQVDVFEITSRTLTTASTGIQLN